MVLGLRFGAGAAISGAGAVAPVAPALATGLAKPLIINYIKKPFTIFSMFEHARATCMHVNMHVT